MSKDAHGPHTFYASFCGVKEKEGLVTWGGGSLDGSLF